MSGLGIVLGLVTAGLWTAAVVSIEAATKALGNLAVNLLRLLLACVLFLVLSLQKNGTILPVSLTFAMWRDLALSGLFGFVLGDILLLDAFVRVGSRLSMLVYASVPAMTAIGAYLFMNETLGRRALLGMLITTLGIATAVYGGKAAESSHPTAHRARGILSAVGASAGQAAGYLLGKRGSVGLDSFSATQVRALAGALGFLLIAVALRRLRPILGLLRDAMSPSKDRQAAELVEQQRLRKGLILVCCATVLGPFLGVSLALRSLQLLPSGVASTLLSIVPALLVPVSIVFFHERVTIREIGGTIATLLGVAILSF